MTRAGFYDKPVFSSTSSSQSAGFGYSPVTAAAAMMPQQQQQHGQQQQQHGQQPMMLQQQTQSQVRHNNPLLNLLPGYMTTANEVPHAAATRTHESDRRSLQAHR